MDARISVKVDRNEASTAPMRARKVQLYGTRPNLHDRAGTFASICVYIYIISFIAVAMNIRDRYEIIGLCEISHFLKQPCRNVKSIINASNLLKQCSTSAKQSGNRIFRFIASF